MLLRIIGTVLLALGLALGSLVVIAWVFLWLASHRAFAKRSALTIPEYDGFDGYDAALAHSSTSPGNSADLPPTARLPVAMIRGGLGGTPTLHAPLSGRPCAIWEITLYQWNRVENRYDARPVWLHRAVGALEIPFTRTRHLRLAQRHRTLHSIDEGGLFRPTGAVAFETGFTFAHRSQLAPMTTSHLTHLQAAGLSEQLAERIAADLGAYGVKESYLAPGDRISGAQMREQFLLGSGAEDRVDLALAGCLLSPLLAASIIAALIGYQLLS
jgi:hypothetical protein